MTATISARRLLMHPYFSVACILSLFFILLRHGNIAAMVASASILTAYVVILPESFRTRTGSMLAAAYLVAGMWVATAIITVMILAGEIQG